MIFRVNAVFCVPIFDKHIGGKAADFQPKAYEL